MESEDLTREELHALDDEVARRVMGWHWSGAKTWCDQSGSCHFLVWRPTTRIECAWAVVKALVARGWRVAVEGVHPTWYTCYISSMENTLDPMIGFAGADAKAPLAISRAALGCADWAEAQRGAGD